MLAYWDVNPTTEPSGQTQSEFIDKPKCAIFIQKIGYLGQKVNFFVLESRFLSTGPITAVFTFGRKVFFWPRMRCFWKKHPTNFKRMIFIWEKGTFLFAQLSPVVARTWLEERSGCYFLAQKSFFAKFWQRPFCSPPRDGSFPTLE